MDRDNRSRQNTAERQRIDQARAAERRHGGHAFREHVDVTSRDTLRRAQTGINARGMQEVPRSATRWTSAGAMLRTADAARRSDTYREKTTTIDAAMRARPSGARPRFAVRMKLEEALGQGAHRHAAGHVRTPQGVRTATFDRGSTALVVFRRDSSGQWQVHTCYPEP